MDRLTRVDRTKVTSAPANAVRRRQSRPHPGKSWAVGDQVSHASFGIGEITHTFGSGEKVSIAVKFPGMGPKILDPRLGANRSGGVLILWSCLASLRIYSALCRELPAIVG